MFIKLSSDVVVNTKYITAIEPFDWNNGKPIKYTLHMVDGHHWHLTEEDYCEISHYA